MTAVSDGRTLDALEARLVALPGVSVDRDAPAGFACTYRTGGHFALLVTIDDHASVEPVAVAIAGTDVETIPVGKGSNLLISDAGFPGVAVRLGEGLAAIDIVRSDAATDSTDSTEDGRVLVRAGGAAGLPIVARATVKAGLAGFEWAVGVPGTIGGAVFMNAGGHGSDMSASLAEVTVADLRSGELDVRKAESLDLGYRRSNLDSSELVVSATLALEVATDDVDGDALLKEIVSWRRANQPGGPNAGSVFTNPVGDSAGRLIDTAGGKDLAVGGASVSSKHANFIQAGDGASADDVVTLMEHVAELVERVHGVRLTAETRLIGFDPERVARLHGEGAT